MPNPNPNSAHAPWPYCRFAYREDFKKVVDREGSRLLSKFAQLLIKVL